MALTQRAQSDQLFGVPPALAQRTAATACRRRSLRVGRAISSALRRQTEAMESRMLLSSYTPSVLENFGVSPNGSAPTSTLVADANGNLYGNTSRGGSQNAGTVFEISKATTTITTLASFDNVNESYPAGAIVLDSSGNLYGTTTAGGPWSGGAVYEIASGSNTVTTVAFFNGQNGSSPKGLTLDAEGNLYGATSGGGTNNAGTVFEVAKGSTAITTVASLSAATGSHPQATVSFDTAGNLYGTAEYGGEGDGTVFEIAKGTSTVTALALFTGLNGSGPVAGVTIDVYGNLYGTTLVGGANQLGTVFEIASGSGTIKTLASLRLSGTGWSPYGGVVLGAGGILYGTAFQDEYTDGTVFEVNIGSGLITTVASFDGANGASPTGGLLLDAAGNLYGTAQYGANGTGDVFEIPSGSTTIAPLASFAPAGWDVNGQITMDASGNFWGVSPQGGSAGYGSVFELPKGSNLVTTIATFTSDMNTESPNGGLAVDAAGNLYGTTSSNVVGSAYGSVFEIANGSSTITILASFNGTNGGIPPTGVILDSSRNLYGTTSRGGANGGGTVFEIPRGSNTIVTLASFELPGPWDPQAGLALDSFGNLYGTTSAGGPRNCGTVFEIASGSNTITTLATFNSTDGIGPDAAVTLDAAGNLYGTTSGGGANGGFGTVFEIAKGSFAVTTLASFNGSNGSDPQSAVIFDAAGNLYGTTTSGGPNGGGTVFKLAKGANTITDLSSFPTNGGYTGSLGQLMLDGAGNLYAATTSGSSLLLKFTPNSAVALNLTNGSNPSGAGQPLTFMASVTGGVPDGETVTLLDASNNNAVVAAGTLAGGSATLTVPAGTLSLGTHNLIAVYGGDANFAASESAAHAQVVQTAPPSLVGAPVVNGDNPSGLFNAPGQPTPGVQRSMVEDLVYTFSEPVVINDANAAFTLALAGQMTGTLPTTLYATAVAGSNGTQWAVSLTGQAEGTLASIANGEYRITINPAYVFAAADGTTPMTTGRTDTFYRLYGDINGDRIVNNADNLQFGRAQATYNPAFDSNSDGFINNADNLQFRRDQAINFFSDGFITTI